MTVSYRDWSSVNVEKEYRERLDAYAKMLKYGIPHHQPFVHTIDLLEYEVHDRDMTHLYDLREQAEIPF